MKRFAIIFLFIILLLSFPLEAFAQDDKLDEVTLQLRWDHQFQFAGYYAADWKGFYEDEGIDVNIISAIKSDGTILSSTKEVGSGNADFGIGSADILFANDGGADLHILASIFQKSAARYYLKDTTTFNSVTDLTELRVARNVNDLIDIELQAMLMQEGIDPTIVKAYNHQAGMDHLIDESVQVMPGYALGTPYVAELLGVKIKEINPQSYGVDFYGDSLFARGELIDNDPELVERFLRASLKGWEYAINNSEEIIALIIENFGITQDGQDRSEFYSFNSFQADIVMDLTSYPIVEIGHIHPYRWEKMSDFLYDLDLIENEVNIDDIIFDPIQMEIDQANRTRDYLTYGGLGALAILLVVILWAFFLKRSVRRRTAELVTANKELACQNEEKEKRADELVESNDQLTRTIDGSPIPIMLHAEDGEVIKISKTWTTITGYTHEDIPTTEIWSEKAFGAQQAHVNSKITSLYLLEGQVHGGEFTLKTKDGHWIIWDFYDAYIGKLQDGRRIVMSVAIDITDKKKEEIHKAQIEEKLRDQQKLESIGTLASGVAHEINNPINGIMNYGQLILDTDTKDSTIKESAEEIIHESNRIAIIVKNLLDFSRQNSESGAKARIEDIVEQTLSLIKTIVKHDQITLELIVDKDLPDVECRSQQIQQVMMNLLTNARDALNDKYDGYNEDKKIIVRCDKIRKQEKDWVRFSVEDHGNGISKEVQEKVFDPFFSTKGRTQGTGLGLSISYGIIQEHGGELSFDTKEGEFTKFTVILPIKKSN